AQDVNTAGLTPTAVGLTINYGTMADPNTYTYNPYALPVNFGNGIITQTTTIGVVTAVNGDTSLAANVVPKMGVGVNNQHWVGQSNTNPSPPPGNASPVLALPGVLSQGVLLNGPDGYLQFGANPLPSYASVTAAPQAPSDTLQVLITGPG